MYITTQEGQTISLKDFKVKRGVIECLSVG